MGWSIRDIFALDLMCFIVRRQRPKPTLPILAPELDPEDWRRAVDDTVMMLIEVGMVAAEWSTMAQHEVGHVLIAKLFEFADDVQRQNLLDLFLLDFGYAVYSSKVGAQLIQKITSFLSESQRAQLIATIQRQHAMTCCLQHQNQYGHGAAGF